MAILGVITGWEVEEGDFIILQGTECHVKELLSDDDADYSEFRIWDCENDIEESPVKIYLSQQYEIWGE